ncbi:MAG: flippase [Pseudomonadota bacterium]|nr:flippase [Pseudomonadota bacterium]
MFLGQGLSFAIQGLYFIVLARLLGSLQYGVLAGAIALVAVTSQFSTMGSGLLLLRYVSGDHSRFREFWGNALMSTALFGSLLVAGLHITARWTIGRDGAAMVAVLAIGDCLFAQLTSISSQVFQAFEKMRITAMLNLLSNASRLALAFSLLVFLHRTSAWLWAVSSLITSGLAVSIAVTTVTMRFGRPIFKPRLVFNRAREGIVWAISGTTTSAYNDLDKVMLGHYGMTVANGIYSMAYRIVNIATMPIMSIQAAALPRYFREGAKGVTATVPLVRRILKRTVVIGLLGATAMYVTAPLIPHLVGKDFGEGVDALRWLCVIPILRCIHVGAGDAISGAGYQKFRLASQFGAASLNLVMNLFLIPLYSWRGAALASLATDGALAVMNWTMLSRLKKRELKLQSAGIVNPLDHAR